MTIYPQCPDCLSTRIMTREPVVIDTEVNQTLLQMLCVCVDCKQVFFKKYWEVYSKGKIWEVDIVNGKNVWPDEYLNT